jgi:hypothetical protein
MSDDHRLLDSRAARPQSKAFLHVDTDNAYAQLGLSPLASTEEIETRISELRARAIKRARATGARSEEAENEVLRLDKIDAEIGDQRRRDEYDEKYPQNILLTVQPSRLDEAWLKHRKASLLSDWLYEQLTDDPVVPTPRCLRFWAPGGIDATVLAFLERFVDSAATTSPEETAENGSRENSASLPDLDSLIKEI